MRLINEISGKVEVDIYKGWVIRGSVGMEVSSKVKKDHIGLVSYVS